MTELCPDCHSANIDRADALGVGASSCCRKCGWVGRSCDLHEYDPTMQITARRSELLSLLKCAANWLEERCGDDDDDVLRWRAVARRMEDSA